MNKLSKIFLIIILILTIILTIMTYYYLHWRKAYFHIAYELYQVREIWRYTTI